jgi:hypothetical protein
LLSTSKEPPERFAALNHLFHLIEGYHIGLICGKFTIFTEEDVLIDSCADVLIRENRTILQ